MHLRPYQPQDISAMADIEADCNLEVALSLYMTKDIDKYPTSYRSGCVRFLQTKLLHPGTLCWVVETDDHDDVGTKRDDGEEREGSGKSNGGEVVGWAIWSRHGETRVARNWQRPGNIWSTKLELNLQSLRNRYYSFVDPTLNHANIASIQPVLSRPRDPKVFQELWELDGLSVSRACQRRGLGMLMLRWGLDQAAAEGVPVVVRSSPVGMWLYEKAGFQAFEVLGFEKYFETGDRGMYGLVWEPGGMEGKWYERAKKKAEEY